MKHDRTMKHRAAWIVIAGVLAVCLGALCATNAAAQSAALDRKYVPASVRALPGLQCKVHPAGNDPSSGLTVFTNDDGYARFHAVRALPGDAVQLLTLDCRDSAGKAYSYSADLTSDDTFTPRPVDLAKEHGIDRPALKGDPLSYTQSELIRAGYGLRPDPAGDPAAYSRWLESASKPGRMLAVERYQLASQLPKPASHKVEQETGNYWAGSLLQGSQGYYMSEATFNIPMAVPGGDQTTETAISIWNGVGGYGKKGQNQGLIQGGVDLGTTPNIATYSIFREYAGGDPDSNGYGGKFAPFPGDMIYSQEWYCDSSGNPNINGGYGCTFLQDLTSGAIFSCTSSDGTPCWSVKANPLCSDQPNYPDCFTLGHTAEFIIEDDTHERYGDGDDAFTDFTGTVTMSGSALSEPNNQTIRTNISNDPSVVLFTDWTVAPTHIIVSLGETDQTYFSISKSSPPTVPTNVTAKAGNAQAVVSFTAPSDTGGGAIKNYTVCQNPGTATTTGTSTTITVTGLTNGTTYTFTVTATNSDDMTSPASSPSNEVTPEAYQTDTRVSSSENSSTYGDYVTFEADVVDREDDIAGGTIQFVVDTWTLGGPVTLSGGTAYSIPYNQLSAGKHTVWAIYTPDAYHQASRGSLIQTVTRASSTTTVSSNVNPASRDEKVTFTAFVSGPFGNPTGNVQFQENGINIGAPVPLAAKLIGGKPPKVVHYASIVSSFWRLGGYSIRANYQGDTNFLPSAGGTLEVVNK
ncbi:MAG TPA: Ig-like domain repeat protein [Syntrophobacteraceae bacterium]|nr:Ig-like domain repeat protein [Syntrophobacteraceae bacterium]